MRYLLALSMTLAAGAICPVAASADPQDGAGLYEPFPRAVATERARDFVAGLPAGSGNVSRRLSVSNDQLREGAFVLDGRLVSATEVPAAGAASVRAAAPSGLGPSTGAAALLAAGALGLGLGLTISRRRA